MGNLEGRSSRAYTVPGGPEIQVDGVPNAGNRGQLELTELGPFGPPRLPYRQVDWDPADNGGANRIDVAGHWGGHGRAHDDAGGAFGGLAVPIDTTIVGDTPLLDPASVGGSGFLFTALMLEQVSIAALGGGPTISLGITGPGFADVIPATVIALTSSPKRVLQIRPHDWGTGAGFTSAFVPAGSTLTLRVSAGAAAAAALVRPYLVGLVLR